VGVALHVVAVDCIASGCVFAGAASAGASRSGLGATLGVAAVGAADPAHAAVPVFLTLGAATVHLGRQGAGAKSFDVGNSDGHGQHSKDQC